MRRRREKRQHNSFHLERVGGEDGAMEMRHVESGSNTESILPRKVCPTFRKTEDSLTSLSYKGKNSNRKSGIWKCKTYRDSVNGTDFLRLQKGPCMEDLMEVK